jgi:hypothetical protein
MTSFFVDNDWHVICHIHTKLTIHGKFSSKYATIRLFVWRLIYCNKLVFSLNIFFFGLNITNWDRTQVFQLMKSSLETNSLWSSDIQKNLPKTEEWLAKKKKIKIHFAQISFFVYHNYNWYTFSANWNTMYM